MAGPMNRSCFPYRTALTEHQLLGTQPPAELRHHLAQCADCRREAVETDDVVRSLLRSGTAPVRHERHRLDPNGLPSRDLRERIVRVVTDSRPTRRHPVARLVVGAAAAAVVATAVVLPMSRGDEEPSPAATSVTLARQGEMVERSWGTEVPVVLSGLEAGRTYRMTAVNAAGRTAPGGSVRGEGSTPVSLRMVTAMPRDTITALLVEDEDGRVVTRLAVRPATT